MNFFKANPYANNLNYQDSNGDNNYNGLQVQLNKQLSRGLMANVSYTWSHALGTQGNVEGQAAEDTWITLRDARLSYSDTAFDHRHSLTTYWTYDLPMGKGRMFLGSPIRSSMPIRQQLEDRRHLQVHLGRSGLSSTAGAPRSINWADGGVVFDNGLTPEGLVNRLNTIVGDYDPVLPVLPHRT